MTPSPEPAPIHLEPPDSCPLCRRIRALFAGLALLVNEQTGHLVWPGQKERGA